MRRAFAAALIAVGLVCGTSVRAQTFGQFTGAEPLPVNGRLFGGYIQSSENSVGLLGQLRLSFYPNVDFGFMGGVSRQDLANNEQTTTVRLGVDMKVGITKQSDELPVTIAVGGNLGVETGDEFSILRLEPTVVGSHTFPSGSGSITPYARLGFAFSRLNIRDTDETDFSVPVLLGGDFRLGPRLGIVVELQLHLADSFNDDVSLAGGVNIPF